MKLTLLRSQGLTRRTAPPTFGRVLKESGEKICYTQEPEARSPGATQAMPEGTYRLVLEELATHGPTLVVKGVPGMGDIPLTPDGGLLAFGTSLINTQLTPGTGRTALAMVKVEVEKATKRGEDSWLEVRS